MEIKDIYVEKDYWVCFVLDQIFKKEYKDDILFKGGTSLTKCYNLLERFSEDIDLVVLRNEGESIGELVRKRDSISKMIHAIMPEVHIEGFTKLTGSNRRSAHSYNKEFNGDFGQVKDSIYIDASHMEVYEPQAPGIVNSYVGEMMEKIQPTMIAKYELWPVPVKVLDPTRTICDKIMSLVRMSHMDNPIESFKGKIRHIYDLHMLLQHNEYYNFFISNQLDEMIKYVIQHDRVSYDNIQGYLDKHPKDALLFNDIDRVWPQISGTYNGSFADLVYGKLPKEDEIVETLRGISKRLSGLTWPPLPDRDRSR
jgi:hypothetical protein